MNQLQELIREMERYLPILERAQNGPAWSYLTKGTGIATINGYVNALSKARSLLGDLGAGASNTDEAPVATLGSSSGNSVEHWQLQANSAKLILMRLCELKNWKDTIGKDLIYESEKENAWDAAFKFLNLPRNKKH